jgi:methyltransferase-like protein/SAM-dependent methyltransferase
MVDTPRLATPTAPGTPLANSYDELPYHSRPYSQTHPSRLATVATLFGLNPPAVDNCRVLELGSASGGNLLPMAEAFPNSRFVGVDLSARQIADGQKVIRRAGLSNVCLRHADILDIDDSWGPFDYILCHGVFSWVPDPVRDKILAVCRHHLTPHGVAYISYNTYPGWHMRGMVRDMMRYHAARFDTPSHRVQQARALLAFLAETAKNDTGPYGTLLRAEVENLRNQTDSYLYHEHLEEVNEPLYFHQFVALADRHKLRYLGEARITTMVLANFSPEVRTALAAVSADQIQAEQYLDFVRNRTFRETLLVRDEATPNWAIQPDSLRRLHITLPYPLTDPTRGPLDNSPVQYQTPSGLTVSTSNPTLKAALRLLIARWPATIPFPELDQAVSEMLGTASDGGKTLALGLLQTYLSSDLVEFHAAPIRYCPPGPKPRALAEARARLAIGELGAATRRHDYFQANEFERQLLPLLDGTRDRPAILDELVRLTLADELSVQRNGKPLTEPDDIRAALSQVLERTLESLARIGMLCD